MRLGRTLARRGLVLVVLAVPALTGCGLFDEGSTAEEAFEYLPADTFHVQFSDRKAMAERLGIDDIDPRDVSDGDFRNFLDSFGDEDEVIATKLTPFVAIMRDDPLNDFDIEWEATAVWDGGTATAWKVGDDLDFHALADDLTETGYERDEIDGLPTFAASVELAEGKNVIGDAYPGWMLNVLLDEDEQLVVTSVAADPLHEIADVIADDADSLADDGGMDDLLDAADGDPELVLLATDDSSVCPDTGRPLPEELASEYDDLGRPSARALFISPEQDRDALLALQYDSEDAAKDDLDAREALIDDGVDIRTLEPFADLGDFSVEQDGEFLFIETDYEHGAKQAVQAEAIGAGPGACLPGTPRIAY
ncbi:hypothetical protein D0Z08_07500 [Nocardioides immobilis]|uniref:DUF3352 domain-containing protein n=1 Tax=Nocardioides immobilis TaxID=2049295 RepID=A0A417Y4K7_9ACTN|nr:hypothetical protein [Nocardioides immobilis]RHW27525.1 hypothetical protein D0Z08_07500 [Nocardioides immobilis]